MMLSVQRYVGAFACEIILGMSRARMKGKVSEHLLRGLVCGHLLGLLLSLLLLLCLLVLRGLDLRHLPRRANMLCQSYGDKHQHQERVPLHCTLSVTDRMLNRLGSTTTA